MDTTEELRQSFEKNLQRIIDRNQIRQGLSGGLHLNEIRNNVRNNLNRELPHRLVNELFVVNPEADKIMEELQKKVENEFPGVYLVLLGSAAHGGAELRKALRPDAAPFSDLDIGIIYDGDFSESISKNLTFFLDTELSNHKIKICDVLNPAGIHLPMLKTPDDARQYLTNLLTPKPGIQPGLSYFSPSYPPRINQENQRLILSALTEIGSKDLRLWHQIREQLFKTWQMTHKIKAKHIPNIEDIIQPNANKTIREFFFRYDPDGGSTTKAFEQLIDSTSPY